MNNAIPANGNIYRVVGNLSACTTVSLNFDYRRVGLEATDFLYIDASANGGAAFTSNVASITAGNDATCQASSTIYLTTYKANLAIRFRSNYADDSSDNTDADTVYIDNVRLTCLRTISVQAPANMVTVADNINLPASMSMTLNYSVSVNDPAAAGQSSVVNTANVFSNDQVEPLESTTTHLLPPATLTGTVYNDLNGSASIDAGEPGISGVNVTLSTGATTSSDVNGFYSFANLPAGIYSVTETDPAGFASTGDVQGANDNVIAGITLTAGSTSSNYNFFDWLPATVSGHLYYDVNGNGTQNSGEVDLANVDVLV